MSEELYLGIDGGQSHTEAIVADGDGNILGRGHAGPANHADQPGGRERLRNAIETSVAGALGSLAGQAGAGKEFVAAHCAMTGGADYKEQIIGSVLRSRQLVVAHDAPAALAGAMGGASGVVVISGTGSVAYGERQDGRNLRIGGWGFLFGDEGSGFWMAAEGVRRAMRAFDGMAQPTSLHQLAVEYFGVADLTKLPTAVYHEEISRDRLASFAICVQRAATEGDVAAREVVEEAGWFLARLAATTVERLDFPRGERCVACVGGVFRGDLVRQSFAMRLSELLPETRVVEPRFDPAVGALLLAYRLAGRERTDSLLLNLARQPSEEGAHQRL